MASTSLSRNTWGTATNDKIFTMSVWVKRSGLGYQQIVNSYDGSTGNDNQLKFQSTDAIELTVSTGIEYFLKTNRLFRDTSAWYHIVFTFDSTQATSSDRYKLYVNGTQETSFSSVSYPPQNTTYQFFRNSNANNIGSQFGASGGFFNGSMSHFHFIDGTAYDATAFGQYDANGVWTIKTSPSVTYGTNGFFILKNGNSVTDQSGNGNNFTVGGGTLTNTEDNPSNVFTCGNPLVPNDGTFYWGNTEWQCGSALNWQSAMTTLGATSGKYYAEFKITGQSADSVTRGYFGIVSENDLDKFKTELIGASNVSQVDDHIAYGQAGDIYKNSISVTSQSTLALNDCVSVAMDLDNRFVYFAKNGVWQNSGVPTSGATGTGGISFTDNVAYFFAIGLYRSGKATANFGNGYFAGSAVASAGTNASGIGIFEYDVPTGYTALSTKGLNL